MVLDEEKFMNKISEEKIISKKKSVGFWPVVFALSGNGVIAFLKLAGFLISGSGAMFSEAIHSFADTANQGLLLVGIKRSTKEANSRFSYGFGQERFFWALVSACGVFFIGSGVTVYHGISALVSDSGDSNFSFLAFSFLCISLIVESFTLAMAVRELCHAGKGNSFSKLLKNGDPSTLAVVFEDGAAVLGVLIAMASMGLAKITGESHWDSIGSIIIGILLGVVAILLINKNREYLIEKAMPKKLEKIAVRIMENDPAVEKVLDFKSSTLDAGVYRMKCEVEFNGPALLSEMFKNGDLREEYLKTRGNYKNFLKFSADFVDRIPRLIGNKIDSIEKKIQSEIPQMRHVDIELN